MTIDPKTEPILVLLIFVNEADIWYDAPLYSAIVNKLRELGVAGATAQSGLMGFGHHHVVTGRGVFGVSAERPVAITVVDTEQKIRSILPAVQELVQEGLILLLPGERVPVGRQSQ